MSESVKKAYRGWTDTDLKTLLSASSEVAEAFRGTGLPISAQGLEELRTAADDVLEERKTGVLTVRSEATTLGRRAREAYKTWSEKDLRTLLAASSEVAEGFRITYLPISPKGLEELWTAADDVLGERRNRSEKKKAGVGRRSEFKPRGRSRRSRF